MRELIIMRALINQKLINVENPVYVSVYVGHEGIATINY